MIPLNLASKHRKHNSQVMYRPFCSINTCKTAYLQIALAVGGPVSGCSETAQ